MLEQILHKELLVPPAEFRLGDKDLRMIASQIVVRIRLGHQRARPLIQPDFRARRAVALLKKVDVEARIALGLGADMAQDIGALLRRIRADGKEVITLLPRAGKALHLRQGEDRVRRAALGEIVLPARKVHLPQRTDQRLHLLPKPLLRFHNML